MWAPKSCGPRAATSANPRSKRGPRDDAPLEKRQASQSPWSRGNSERRTGEKTHVYGPLPSDCTSTNHVYRYYNSDGSAASKRPQTHHNRTVYTCLIVFRSLGRCVFVSGVSFRASPTPRTLPSLPPGTVSRCNLAVFALCL